MRLNQRGNFERMMKAYEHKYREPLVSSKTGKQLVNKKGQKLFKHGDMPRVTESDLNLIQPIGAGGQNLFTFPVLENVGTPLPEEIRLNQNDEFTICEVGIFLYGIYEESSEIIVNPLQSRKTWTYAPVELSQVFIAVEDFWEGVFTIDVNNVRWVDKWLVDKHFDAKQTTTQVYGTATTGADPAAFPYRNGHESGIIEMTPTVTMSGAKKYIIQITLPYSITPVLAVPFTDELAGTNAINIDHVRVLFRGFNAQNAADFQTTHKKKKRVKAA